MINVYNRPIKVYYVKSYVSGSPISTIEMTFSNNPIKTNVRMVSDATLTNRRIGMAMMVLRAENQRKQLEKRSIR